MALDELLERTTITFPRRVREKELFKFIVRTLDGIDITYHLDKSVFVGNRLKTRTDEVPVRAHYNRITGVVCSVRDDADFECFKKSTRVYGSGFYGIKFFTTPSYELSEIPPSRLKLMDSVRTTVEKYFSAHPQHI